MSRSLAPGMQLSNELRLVQTLGRGAMGEVWIGSDARLGQVAVKFLAANLQKDDAAVQRFEREWTMASDIDSPYVVRMYAKGRTAGGRHYIVMELLEGESLEERLAAVGSLPSAEAVTFLRQVAHALDAAHARGIVHRDIKPENVLVCKVSAEGGTAEVGKVLDFGLAKPWDGGNTLTLTGILMGTPYYMSPEQLLAGGKNIDHRADLWALAAMAFRMLFGCQPFDADTLHDLVFEICKGAYQPLENVGGPLELDPWFKRAFQVERDKRFESAGAMIAELATLLARADTPPLAPAARAIHTLVMDPSARAALEAAQAGDDRLASTQIIEPSSPGAPPPVSRSPDSITAPIPMAREAAPESTTLVRQMQLAQARAAAPPPVPPAPSAPAVAAVAAVTAVRASEPPPQFPSVAPPRPSTFPAPAPSAMPGAPPRLNQGTVGALVAIVIAAVGLAVLGGSWLSAESTKPEPSVARSEASSPAPIDSPAKAPEPPPLPHAPPKPTPAAPPSPVTSATQAKPTGSGRPTLTVTCDPPCIVLIDGTRIGVSPVKERPTTPGPHKVTAYRDGVGAKSRDVDLAPGEQATLEFSMAP